MSDDRKFEISWEAADSITKDNLSEAYGYLSKETADLQSKLGRQGKLEEHEIADLGYNEVMLQHIKAVLSYYGETV